MPKSYLLISLGLIIAAAICDVNAQAPVTRQSEYSPHQFGLSWKDQARAALAKQEFAQGRDLMRKWLEADPPDPDAWYDLTCAYARLGDTSNALDALDCAADAGFKDARHAQADADLEAIRADARFSAAVERMSQSSRTGGPEGFIRHFAPMMTIGTYIVMLPPDYQTANKEYPIC